MWHLRSCHPQHKKEGFFDGVDSKLQKNHLLTPMLDDLGSQKTSATWSRLLTLTSGNHGRPDTYLFFPGSFTVLSFSKHADVHTAVIYIYWSHERNPADGKEVRRVRLCFPPHMPSSLVGEKVSPAFEKFSALFHLSVV